MEKDQTTEPVGHPPVNGVRGGGTGYGWSEFEYRQEECFGRHFDARSQATAALLSVWPMPNTANVGHQEPPRPLEKVNLLAARGERESVQIALRPKVSWCGGGIAGFVRVHCSDLISADGHRMLVGEEITLRKVVPVLGVPDALVPLPLPSSEVLLLPGETLALWLSVDVPQSQLPGQYECEVYISAVHRDTMESAPMDVNGGVKTSALKKRIGSCLDKVDKVDRTSLPDLIAAIEEMRGTLAEVLLSPVLSEANSNQCNLAPVEDSFVQNLSEALCVKISLNVWNWTLPMTPSLPAVFGISETVIEDRYGLEHGKDGWFKALDMHFKWLLQFKISPYFCRWGDGMSVVTYTCPWPASSPKAEEYYADPRLAAYALPFQPVGTSGEESGDALKKELETLKDKPHWKKAYFYLWDEPLSSEQYHRIRDMATKIKTIAADARILTTYYCGPRDVGVEPGTFEAFLNVPNLLRPLTQIYCTSEWALGGREELAEKIMGELHRDEDEEWWTYICIVPGDPHPNWHLGMRGTQHRAVMWRVWKEGGKGFLYWGANCYERACTPAAEVRFRPGLPPGDGVLFYPGEVFNVSSNTPVASIRLERILSGLQDYEYLELYAARHGRANALDLMEKTGLYSGPERYTLEHAPVEMMRGEVARSILAVP